MKGTEWMLVISTFMVGAMAGGYFYVTAYKPSIELQKQEINKLDWEIIAREIGSCQTINTCPEFYIAADRVHKYSPDGNILEEGKVTKAVRNSLSTALKAHNREEDAQSDGSCQYVTDEVNYIYDIDAYGERYTETTCDTQFAASPLARTLDTVWQQVATGEYATSSPVILERGVQGWLEEYLDRQFEYDD